MSFYLGAIDATWRHRAIADWDLDRSLENPWKAYGNVEKCGWPMMMYDDLHHQVHPYFEKNTPKQIQNGFHLEPSSATRLRWSDLLQTPTSQSLSHPTAEPSCHYFASQWPQCVANWCSAADQHPATHPPQLPATLTGRCWKACQVFRVQNAKLKRNIYKGTLLRHVCPKIRPPEMIRPPDVLPFQLPKRSDLIWSENAKPQQ